MTVRLLAFSFTALSFTAIAPSASAQQSDDCIENIAGVVVCGAQADAVRARMRAEARYAADPDKAKRQARSGSIYNSFGQSVFLRGGYIFASHGGGEADSASAPLGAIGYRSRGARMGNHVWSFESEVVYARDSEDIVADITLSGFTLAGLLGARWEYATGTPVSPYASVGIGPVYVEATVSDGVIEINDDTLAFGYSGRAGMEVQISNGVSVDLGYRYLGATNQGTAGLHTAEGGLNFNF